VPKTKNGGAMPSKTNKERARLMKTHGHLYKRHFISEGYYCFYCGAPGQCLDHVPPIKIIDSLDQDKLKKDRIPKCLIPSCNECNSRLGDKPLITVMERLLYLESYYEAFFKKQKAKWTDEEINELGGSLREYVRHHQDKLNLYLDKIRNIQLRMLRDETHPRYIEKSRIDNEEWSDK
jgi:hypothetical protein